MPTDHIDLYLHQPRSVNMPPTKATIPSSLVYDFDKLLARAQEVNPLWTPETLLRYLFIKGLSALAIALDRNNLPDPNRTFYPSHLRTRS